MRGPPAVRPDGRRSGPAADRRPPPGLHHDPRPGPAPLRRAGAPAGGSARAGRRARAGLQGQFFSTPTSIMAGFGGPGNQRACLVREQPGDVDLEKLVELDDLTDRLTRIGPRLRRRLARGRRDPRRAAALPRRRCVGAGRRAGRGRRRAVLRGRLARDRRRLRGRVWSRACSRWVLTRRPTTARIHEAAAALVATALATWAAACARAAVVLRGDARGAHRADPRA